MDALAKWAHANMPAMSEVCGPVVAANRCADRLATLYGKRVRTRTGMRIFQLTRVIPPRRTPGAMRVADERDLDLMLEWMEAFRVEIGEPHELPHARLKERLGKKHFHLWEDPGPVAIAGWTGRTPNGVRINSVYTPPQHRGRGYASNLVAALTQEMLDEGRKFCFLYTDAANPTSNKIYQQIGYEFVSDWANLALL
jgi:predicted GNAT family acetyltransferase